MVSPRYMAGAGDRFADVLGPLIHLFGWRHDHDPATGTVAIDSPDGSVFVDFRPLHPLGRWVTVTHHEPYWKVSFSRQAPLEAVAAVTQALPQLLGDTRHSDRIPITDTPLDQLADLHDWAAGDEGGRRPGRFCHRGQLVGNAYLNDNIIPALCQKAGIPAEDSRGALTSHRARSTIATQLLNARDPLTLGDLHQWLGHKHPASTRYYAKILQRTLTAAYRKADYFARNIRTIEVLIDRDSILTGAAAGGEQPWKYYDLGDGYCSYDFFAKCPHRMACARCPFYVPKESTKGQLLAVKDGINRMLEQVDLTDDEREALEGDRDAVTALVERLADIPTPAGPTPKELGTESAFIPLTQLTDTISRERDS